MPEFKAIEAPHQHFYKTGLDVMKAVNVGDYVTARRLTGEAETLSGKVIKPLMGWFGFVEHQIRLTQNRGSRKTTSTFWLFTCVYKERAASFEIAARSLVRDKIRLLIPVF